MCGIAGIFGESWKPDDLAAMVASQCHRGPDGDGIYLDPRRKGGLGHNRLSILDLSAAGNQPMVSRNGNLIIVLNGEIYNYLELKKELECEYVFTTRSDTEVLLAAYQKWGERCLEHLVGMFAFVVWDESENSAFAARDRFGVKPLYYHQSVDGTLSISSEIKALHAVGVSRTPDEQTWASYLSHGLYDHSEKTFWKDIHSLPGGHCLTWRGNRVQIKKWYDLAERIGDECDDRPELEVQNEYFELMKESVKLRFRSDVAVGINLSGGLDSSSLLGLVHEVQGADSDVTAFTFTTGDRVYDELQWVEQMLARTKHPLVIGRLTPDEVPALAENVQYHQDEPFGGLPTLAYAKLFQAAKENGVKVLLDGNGMDEQWAGYDYYQPHLNGTEPRLIQGIKETPVRPDCLNNEFRNLAKPILLPDIFRDRLRNLQYRDTRFTKLPRAMRFNDRISMRSSTELREPFLDHRLFELAMRQSANRKINGGVRKKMLREISRRFLPRSVSAAPKRAVQTPQREWLRGPLQDWTIGRIDIAIAGQYGSYLDKKKVKEALDAYFRGESDNSFYIWQWISMGLHTSVRKAVNK
ncbi:MAG: asparagine synthase (glutamine-hydrolyzing) [Acidobacteria bacterium]|nr:asparagine synthase (glutamine-hydrolyzing) [Acidobacteriota bacterium]